MRIIYLHQYFNTLGSPGCTRSYEMARRLVQAGHEVHMVTSDQREGKRPGDWFRTSEEGIQVHWLPVPYSNHMTYRQRIRAFGKFAWGAGPKAAGLGGDVVLAMSSPLTIALPAVYAAKKNKIPMVFEIGDLWPALPIAMGALKNPITIKMAGWLERFAYRHSSTIIT